MNERLSQLDTKLLCFRSPQHLSRHLLDATILLLLEKEALFTTVLVKKKKGQGVAQQVKVQLAVHDSSPLVS